MRENRGFLRRGALGCAIGAAVAALGTMGLSAAAIAADVTPFTVTVPTVTGPIASTPTNFPFIADGFDVEPAVPKGYEAVAPAATAASFPPQPGRSYIIRR